MIPAIDPGFGIKEDQPKTQVSPPGNKDFSQALRKASRPKDATSSEPLRDARKPGEPRDRSLWEKTRETRPDDAGEAKPNPSTETAPKGEAAEQGQQVSSEPDDVEQPGTTPSNHLTPVTTDRTLVAERASAPELTELSLESMGKDEGGTGVHNLNPGMAQIGQMAWKTNPHGKGEPQAAAGNGMVFPGSAEAELMAAAQRQGTADLQFEDSDVLKMADAGVKPLVDPEAEVEVRIHSAMTKTETEATLTEQVQFEAAQGRSRLMQQLSAIESATANQGKAATSDVAMERNLFLQNQLQRNGMLMRNTRTSVLDGPTGSEPAGLTQVTSFNSFKPSQIFELPTDMAVEQRAIERVSSEARWLISNNRQEVRFRLTPEHLGTLHMKIVREDGAIRVDMTVDNLSAKQLLESNLDSLREQLAGGDQASEFLFNVDVRQGNEQPSMESRFAARAVPGALMTEALETESQTGTPGRVLGQSGLSIYA